MVKSQALDIKLLSNERHWSANPQGKLLYNMANLCMHLLSHLAPCYIIYPQTVPRTYQESVNCMPALYWVVPTQSTKSMHAGNWSTLCLDSALMGCFSTKELSWRILLILNECMKQHLLSIHWYLFRSVITKLMTHTDIKHLTTVTPLHAHARWGSINNHRVEH